MASYFLRRFLLIIPTFIGLTMLVFTITRFVPGGPIERMIMQAQQMAQEGGASSVSTQSASPSQPLSEDQMAELRAFYGFDKPLYISYPQWLWRVIRLDLGTSTRYYDPVWEMVKERIPVSSFYGILTLLITYLISVPLGIAKAIKHNTHFDNISSGIVFLGYAIPGYVVGIMVLIVFASNLEWFPMEGFTSDDFEDFTLFEKVKDLFMHAILPLTAYVAGSFAFMSMMMKNALMDHLAADYVRTALAKGVSFKGAVIRHALRNSLIPLATHIGNGISAILMGSFIIETIFNIDGIGLLGYESIVQRDYPVVLGILVLTSLLFLLGNILSDICVAIVDPRVSFH